MPLDLFEQYLDTLHSAEWEECFIHSVLFPKCKDYAPELIEWGLIDASYGKPLGQEVDA